MALRANAAALNGCQCAVQVVFFYGLPFGFEHLVNNGLWNSGLGNNALSAYFAQGAGCGLFIAAEVRFKVPYIGLLFAGAEYEGANGIGANGNHVLPGCIGCIELENKYQLTAFNVDIGIQQACETAVACRNFLHLRQADFLQFKQEQRQITQRLKLEAGAPLYFLAYRNAVHAPAFKHSPCAPVVAGHQCAFGGGQGYKVAALCLAAVYQ